MIYGPITLKKNQISLVIVELAQEKIGNKCS